MYIYYLITTFFFCLLVLGRKIYKVTASLRIMHSCTLEIILIFLGTDEERGLTVWANQMNLTTSTLEERESTNQRQHIPLYNTYNFPIGMNVMTK